MRLVFAGTPEVAVPSLELIAGSSHELLAVLTRPDAPAGRGRRLVRSPVAAWGDAHGVPVLTPGKPREPEFLEQLAELAPDCVPVVAYGALVPPAALAIPRHGWINLHFSLLPAWRGAAPVQHAVLHGDDVTGACVFELEPGLDTGPIYGSLTHPIGRRDTAGDLLGTLAESGARLLLDVLDGIERGEAIATPQPPDRVSMAPKITTADAEIRWQEPAFAVDRRIRACTPAPGAWSTFRGERIRIAPLEPLPGGDGELTVGELRLERGRVLVGTGNGRVQLGDVQPAGKKRMPADAWARGARLEP
ncbi:MAG: methionyl-tRNA formyltransferase, partial [Micromonosporaceae bacterium]